MRLGSEDEDCVGVLLVKVEEVPEKDDTNNGVEVVIIAGGVVETEDILAGGRSTEWVQKGKGTINMCLRKPVKEKR